MIDYTKDKHPWGLTPRPVLIDNLENFKKGSVLDLGCGDGKDSKYLASKGFSVMAVDKSQDAINILLEEKINTIETVCKDILDVTKNFDSHSWDNIISFVTIHFLKKEDGYKTIEWIKSHTNLGGLNIIYDFTKEGDFNIKSDNPMFWLNSNELKELYKDWEIISYKEFPSNTKQGGKQMVAEIVARRNV